MAVGYGKDVIREADRLLKQGKTERQVAKILGVVRTETIADWKRKHGIGKPRKKRVSSNLKKRNLEVWDKVQKDALKKLKEMEYSKAEEIVTALQIAHRCILQIADMMEEKQDEEVKESGIMKLLGGDK